MISLQNRGVPIQLERSLASASNGSAMRSVVGFAEMDAPIKGSIYMLLILAPPPNVLHA
jgi:hypothetical protein